MKTEGEEVAVAAAAVAEAGADVAEESGDSGAVNVNGGAVAGSSMKNADASSDAGHEP